MDNETNRPNPFIGTWENELERWVFGDNDVSWWQVKTNVDPRFTGTYTYNDHHLFLFWQTEPRWPVSIKHYFFKDDRLNIIDNLGVLTKINP